ncbi:DNA-binding CsgD family transcriptional regulator [Sinobacterium caligoides]|uniref:DNA-binding CsgD family transcriptional regulator n=1 Tax=Sinobacterium caligoides TaxID=933926 RepID=A0A3N2DNA2_9GAMM|nr:LuxR C-terminal-related transcriptional regulator [Sinobacterium caligoides]ROS01162.1 DNA-binding CsgD family transcriptional regulator [Sinobacterium caligoides]
MRWSFALFLRETVTVVCSSCCLEDNNNRESLAVEFDSEFSELIELAYKGALEDYPWKSFLSRMRQLLEADLAAIFLQPPREGARLVMLIDGGVETGIDSYEQGLYNIDPFVDLPEGEVKTVRELLCPEKLKQSEFYQRCMESNDLADFMGGDMSIEGEFDGRFRLGRYSNRPHFSLRDKEVCQAVLPHLKQAILFHAQSNRLISERDLYAHAVQQMALGSILLSEEGRILGSNKVASDILRLQDGLSAQQGKLHLGSASRNSQLQQTVTRLLSAQRMGECSSIEAMRISRPSGRSDYGLIIRAIPLSQWSEGRRVPSVAIFVSDPESESPASIDVVTQLFGFTPTEARLALALANGLSVDEASEKLSVSRNTTRTHLRSVFSKAGVTRQSLLIRLILKSVAPLAAIEDSLSDR